ncbi:MAG TPA: 23S rRNA (pseudouridine(1915)-N(3))-methyltransferase RlmH [Gammaproteobacteria bacterium]|jgi:23S rRNA (pseudouridine1915-N3)-methyltransferase
MRITIVAASSRQPAWVVAGFEEYAGRLRSRCTLAVAEIPLGRRKKTESATRAVAAEGERMLAALPKGAHVVALTEAGTQWSTVELAARLRAWMTAGAPLVFLIGGPDGLAAACVERAAERWALSRLTLPHGFARIAVAEALYRAWMVLEGHPYHRG